jgi:protein-L-isoaspartate(D-aspartate) O-methyltransferase
MLDFAWARNRMVDVQLARRGICDRRVLEALRSVPREAFVAEGMREVAYEDSPLEIGEGQTISQPYIVALMIEAAELKPGDRALEVGSGSGYAAAVMAQIADRVFTIERHATLAGQAARRCAELGYRNVTIRVGDGTLGWPEKAPFDAILVAAGGPEPPLALKHQLAVGGRLVVPVGKAETGQELLKLTRTASEGWEEERLGAVRFVPLVGAQGWAQDGARTASTHVPGQARARSLPEMIAEAAEPLPPLDDPDFARGFDRYAARRVVLLGDPAFTAMLRHEYRHAGLAPQVEVQAVQGFLLAQPLPLVPADDATPRRIFLHCMERARIDGDRDLAAAGRETWHPL